MRKIQSLATAFALSTGLFVHAPPTAEACGGYMRVERAPRSFAVSTHFIPRAADGVTHRAFVALAGRAPEGLAWTPLAPVSYDATLIAPAPALSPMTLTLVGEKGTRVVTSARYVYLSQSMFMAGTTLALEVDIQPGETYELALFGEHPSVRWSDVATRASTKADADWVRGRGLSVGGANAVTAYRHGDLELLAAYDAKAAAVTTVMRRQGNEISRHLGWPRGSVELDGKRYLAFGHERAMTLVAL